MKYNEKGFTLIEVMIVLAIAGIILAVILSACVGGSQNGSQVSWGINGAVETRCIEGYKFLVTDGGQYRGSQVTQLKDAQGNAIPCN